MKVTISNTNLTRKSLISAAGTSLFLFSLVLGFFVANFASPVLAYEMPFCTVTVGYSVCTDQADYTPSSIVHIAGSGFSPSNLLVKVTRADGSVVTGDGSFAAWPTAYDTVVADSEGKFQFDYILDGIEGLYAIEVLDSGNNVLASHSFTDAKHTFSITIDSPTGGSVLNPVQASGNVSSINFPGQLTAYIVRIDWGDGSGLTDLNQSTNHLILTTSNGGKDFSGIYKTNTDLAHTYTPGATYTITALLCHQSCTGAEGADATASVTIAVPVTQGTLTVIKHVINNNGGTKQISDFPLFVGATPVTSGVQNTFDAGSYVVSETGQSDYAATISGDCDSDGNVVLNIGNVKSCTITNDDVDTTSPVITLLGSTPVTIEVHSTYTDAGATALDDYDGDLTSSIVTVNPVNTNLVGIYTVTYDVADSNGNSAVQVIRTVNVVDTTLPVITLVGANPQAIEVLNAYTELGATASDNYDGDLTGSIVIDASAVNTNLAGSYTVTYDVVDSNGNHAVQVTRTVNVVDTTAPVIASHADLTIEATSSAGAAVTYISPTATDNYDSSVTVSCSPASGSTFPLGDTTVTCNAQDVAGNHAIQTTFNVHVQDTSAPTIDNVVDIVAEATGPSGASVTITPPMSHDAVDGNLVSSCDYSTGTFPIAVTTVTCSKTDAAGNIATPETFTVTIQDTTSPVITLLGSDPVTVEVHTSYADDGATAFDDYDGDLTSSIVTVNPVNEDVVGDYTVTYDVTDSNGNSAIQVTRTVHVIDTTIPVITLNGANPLTIEVHTDYIEPGAVVTDNYDTGLTATITGTVDKDTVGTYTLYYNAVDSNGNHAAQVTRTVNVVDTTRPIIASHADVTAEATSSSGAIVSYILPTATDNYDSSVSVICTPVSGSTFGLGENVVDCEATDAHSNKATSSFKITVVDTTSPTLNLPADITQEATSPSGAAVSYTATATDLVDGSITPTCLPASGSTFALGTTLVTCSATDAHGNIGSASFNVIVQDTTPPVITLTGANPQTLEVKTAYVELGATALDNFDGDISGSIVIDATNVNMNLVGTYTITYDVTDAHGNNAVQKSRTVNVVDTTPPVITVTGGDETIEIHTPYTDAGATATDNYDSSVTVTSTGTVDVDTLGDYTINYNAVDANGNHAAQKSRTVHVVDTIAPTCSIAEPLKDSYLHGTASIKLSASDSGSGISKVEWRIGNSTWLPTTFAGGLYAATWDTTSTGDGNYTIYGRATDNAGLVTYDPVNVVVDNTPPIITIVSPENITYSSSSVGLTFTVNEPTSSIVYSLDGAPNVSATNTTLTGLADKSHTLTIYATDLTGNQNTATIVFTVSVPPAPEPPAQTVGGGGGIAPSASINSSNILTNKPTAESQVIVQNGRATLWNPSIFVDSVCSEEIVPKSLNVLNPSQSASFAVNFDCKGVAHGEYPVTYSLQLPSGRIIASKTYTLTISESGVSVPNVVILSATSTTLTPGETGTISVTVQNSGDAGTNGNVSLNSKNGFSISPLNIPISLQPGEQKSISFKITSSNNTGLPTGDEMLTGFASLIGINLPSTEKVDVLVDYETPDGTNSVGKAIDVTINPRFPYFLIILFVSLAAGFYYFYFCRRKKKEEKSE
jgi:hypothetical protein